MGNFSGQNRRTSTSLVLLSTAVLALVGLFGVIRPVPAELVQGSQAARDRYVARLVTALLDQQHLLRRPLDDEISRRALKTYIEQLDPMKFYFYQSDVDEFMRSRDILDDMIKGGDISFAYTVFNRFLQRVDERVAYVPELLQQQHDFATEETMETDPDAIHYPRNEAEARDRWRRRIKYDLLVLKADGAKKADGAEKPIEESKGEENPIERLNRRYSSHAKRMHQFNRDDLLEMYLTAMTSSFDPHTSYMSPSTLENFNISMKLNLEGIGAALQVVDGYTVVSRVIPGGAADKQGELKPEDRIISVGQGDDGEMEDVIDMRLNDVVDRIRGKAGTVVRLGVRREGTGESSIRIVRDRIELKDSEAQGIIFSAGQKPDGSAYQLGFIYLPSFYMDMTGSKEGYTDFKSTTRDVRKILGDFRKQGVDVVVLDLRHNGGGSLTEAINLTGLFIDSGPVVQVKDTESRVQQLDDTARGMAWDGPLVVLTSKFSASASEILAGAIQDYDRGIVVGDATTHGKGTVQSLVDLSQQLYKGMPNAPNLGALKITMQQFYLPQGASTQQRGVLADVSLPSTTTHMDIGEADLDYAVTFDTVDPAEFGHFGYRSPEILAQLKAGSETRRSQSEDFAKLLRRIERYREQKDRKEVTLNEAKFLAERAELDAEKEDEKNFRSQEDADGPPIERDFYVDEVINIATDYTKLLGNMAVAAQR